MPVAVNQPQRREKAEDPLDTIIKGLSIASTIYGIKDAGAKRDLLAKQNQISEERLNQQAERDGKRLNLEEQRLELERKNKDREFSLKRDEKNKEKEPKALPASEAVALGGANAAFSALGDANKSFESNADLAGPIQGYVSKLKGFFEYGDEGKRAKSFNSQLQTNAQSVAKMLEGGKLSDQDIERYKKMLPNLNDSPEVAADKTTLLQNLIAAKQQAEAAALQASGYNVSGIKMSSMGKNPNVKNQPLVAGGGNKEALNNLSSPGAHPQDAQAVEWAKNNPRDPRAIQILKMNGM